jgi:hypothetical protein
LQREADGRQSLGSAAAADLGVEQHGVGLAVEAARTVAVA